MANTGPDILDGGTILQATDNFSPEKLIGVGSLSKVFRGNLGGTTVAVKQMNLPYTIKEMEKQVSDMHQLRHPHILMLVAWCPEKICIVNEYLEGGSLKCRLEDGKSLSWMDRFRIASEIASALLYMHNKDVLHLDLKPANILLDTNNKSKLADVGLAKPIFDSRLMLTSGVVDHMDPLYLQYGKLTKHSDTYSFGLVVFQLLTGLSQVSDVHILLEQFHHPIDISIATPVIMEKLDFRAGKWPESLVKELIRWTILCIHPHKRKRPDIKEHLQPALAKLAAIAKPEAVLETSLALSVGNEETSNITRTRSLSEDVWLISTEQISLATDNFSKANLIGVGGYGEVYKGRLSGIQVAVKRLHPGSTKISFETEVQALHTLRHPHVLELIGYDPHSFSFVSEFMEGGNLGFWLRGKEGHQYSLSWEDRVRICREMASGVSYMHNRGVMHRDLKPANVLLDAHKRSKIGDMGLAKLFDGSHVAVSAIHGTKGYMDPQILRTGKVGPHSDTYALGLMGLQILSSFDQILDIHLLIDEFTEKMSTKSHSIDENGSMSHKWTPFAKIISEGTQFDRLIQDQTCLDSLVQFFFERLDPKSALVPRDVLCRALGVLLRCVEWSQEHRPSLEEEVLPALEILDQHVNRNIPEQLSDTVQESSPPSMKKLLGPGQLLLPQILEAPLGQTVLASAKPSPLSTPRKGNKFGVNSPMESKQDWNHQTKNIKCNAGICDLFGEEMSQTCQETVREFIRSGQKSSNALYKLGLCFYTAHVVRQNYGEAVYCFRGSAEKGHMQAQVTLAHCCLFGEGTPQSYHEAVHWYKLSASRGNLIAQCNLGYLCEKGWGVPQDLGEARKWYGLAALKGDKSGQFNFGVCHEMGIGCLPDFKEAVKWYYLASKQGHVLALSSYNRCRSFV